MTVEHLIDKQQFVWDQQGIEAVLDYQLQGKSVNFSRTFVPEALRGQGIAEKLVRTGLTWAKQEGYEIEASCWYVQKFLK
ncbi:N-acetyltransferase [Shewanella sp. SNU WT4]|uniref:GNAT family N-acetyltransferase n=1 Tax=Shewanella sp. SNU WT4 TaxID=2590015 RepID=UPI0011268D4E|nr:GNAT family N-acetyltransferase [Shewanella sp. SNU WT4]QDF67909.1 N-acetyltransferase [Shewanella sp. SNU WT4]